MPSSLKVSEQFLSIQGEGPTSGYPAYFLRLTACNLLCDGQWLCDTIAVWKKGKRFDFSDIALKYGEDFFSNLAAGYHLVVTGGEPMLQQKDLYEFIYWVKAMSSANAYVEIETNGTIEPSDDMISVVNQWNVSPKLANSGEPFYRRYKPKAIYILKSLNSQTVFKFVITRTKDWQEICHDWLPNMYKYQIMLMPAAEDREELEKNLPLVCDIAKKEGIRVCSRMQIEAWNQVTGV